MPHIVTYDNQYVKFDLTELAAINRALDEKKDILFKDKRGRIAHGDVRRLELDDRKGEYGPHIAQGSFEKATEMIESGRKAMSPEELDAIKANIRKIVEDPSQEKKRAYAAEVARYRENGNRLTADQEMRLGGS